MKIRTAKDIGKEYSNYCEEEFALEEGDNYDFTPYNTFMQKKFVSVSDIIEFVEGNCGDIDFIYELKRVLSPILDKDSKASLS
jgi:hypothetical protein